MLPIPLDLNRARREAGFTLVEIVVVLLIFSVIIGMAAMITRGVSAAQKRSLTGTRMATVDAALLQFVQQQKRLPCPGDGTLPNTNNNAGLEIRSGLGVCTGNQLNGVVPWRALALSESEATDGWDRRLTYRVAPELVLDNGMDMTWCDSAGPILPLVAAATCSNLCTSATPAACTAPKLFLLSKGLRVQNNAAVPVVVMDPAGDPPTGAAYFLVSHGESGGGGRIIYTGILFDSTRIDGDEEKKNYANLTVNVPTNPAATRYYVDDALNDTDVMHFDDIVSRPSVLSVATKAGLGPRTH